MTLDEVAQRINDLFDEYGLDHKVVGVRPTTQIHLDRREEEPDPMKWRSTTLLEPSGAVHELYFLEGQSTDRMELFLETLRAIFSVYFEVTDPDDERYEHRQGRLF